MAELVGGGRGASTMRPGLPASARAPRLPRALYGLCAIEAIWACAFFAVQTTLTLFLTSNEATATGASAWPAFVSHVLRRPVSATAAAAFAYGLFSAAAYALPLPGGLIGDRVLQGRARRGVLATGLMLFTGGLTALVLPGGALPGLIGVALGTGLVKSNLVAQLSTVCVEAGVSRAQGFGLYLIAANAGAMAAPVVCGTTGEWIGWTRAHAVAAAVSALAPLVYALIWPSLRSGPPSTAPAPASPWRTWRAAPLIAPLAAEVLFFAAYNQAFSLFPVWARTHVDRRIGGFVAPVTWFGVLDGVFTIAATALALRLWRRGIGGSAGRRVAVGAGLAAAAFIILAAVGDGRVALFPVVGFFLLLDAAIPWVDTTSLARLAAAAPRGWEGGVSGLYFVSAAAASLLTGALGGLYEPGALRVFWGLHVLVAGATALAAFGLRVDKAPTSGVSAAAGQSL